MAKIRSGILSKTTGKVGGVVGASWKGINYIREHINPANPKSTAQQAQRAKMRIIVAFSKPLIAAVLNIYVDPLTRKMSGFNKLVKQNINRVGAPGESVEIQLLEGSLNAVTVDSINTPMVGNAQIICKVTAGANDLPTDLVYACAYSKQFKRWMFGLAEVPVGSSGLATVTLGNSVGVLEEDLIVFTWRIRRDGTQLVAVSTSTAVFPDGL